MSFPADVLRAEMLINGVWTEVTSRIRGSGDIKITSGTRVDSSDLSPTTCEFVINNRDGLFTNDNPNSTYYGLLPANTNFRVAIEESAPFLYLPNGITNDPATATNFSSWIQTADKASLDVVGDLDMRIDVEPDTWQLGGAGQTLAAKFATTSNQRSWAWTIESSGFLRFWWSTDGANLLFADSTVTVPAGARISLRVTIDVNNGSSGRTITFYTAPSIIGTYTQLGATVVQAGTTSIFSSSAPLVIGGVRDATSNTYPFSGFSPPSLPLVGRVHRFRMLSGISGTEVADMNATIQAENAVSWADTLTSPNTWTTQNNAVVTVADYRAYTELADMPQEWDITGGDVYVNITSAGIARRITKDPQKVRSPYRNYNEALTTKSGYWSMEDPAGATRAFTSVPGARLSGQVGLAFGSTYFPPGSDRLADVSSTGSFITYNFAKTTNTTDGWQLGWVARYQPFDDNPFPLLMTCDALDGTDYVITLDVASKIIEVFGQTPTGSILGDATATFSDDWTEWHSFVLKVTQVGGTLHMDLYWRALDDTAGWFNIGDTWTASTSVLSQAQFNGGDVPPDSTVGHVIGTFGVTDDLIADARFNALLGWAGETAAARWLRICRENNIRGLCVGWPGDTQPMGPQPIDTVANILDECAITDSGIQYEARDQPAIIYRTRSSLYAQTAVALDYAAGHLSGSFRPTDDDLLTKNSVTATNSDGSTSTSTVTSGPKSILASPNGVGEYDSDLAVNTEDIFGLATAAQWATFQGTWPGRRVPSVQAQLVRAPYAASATLSRSVRTLNPGDRLTVADVPIWVGGGTADMIVRTYTETIQNSGTARGQLLDFGTVPAGPFSSIPVLGSDTFLPRLDTAAGTTGATMTTTATSVTFVTPAGQAIWVNSTGYPAEFPFDVLIAGERMTVTAISGTSSPQTATVTRSVNGIVKTHASGEAVRLAVPYYAGR